MKKFFIAFSLAIFAFGVVTNNLFAQEFNYSKAREDYIYNLDLYQKAHADYKLAKSSYLRSKTLNSQEEALDKTKKMLETRDEVVKTFLTALRMKVGETEGINNNQKELLSSQIDTEHVWFKDHKDKLASAGSLEDLVNDSNEAKDRYEETQLIIFKSFFEVGSGQTSRIRNDQWRIIERIKSKLAEIRANQDKDPKSTERWLLEVEDMLQRSEGKQGEANSTLNAMTIQTKDKLSTYNKSQSVLGESFQYLKEANFYLREAVREIMTAD